MANATRQNLLDSGMKRFYAEGFRNTGLEQILADAGITKTAFYKHFDSKEELMIEVLKQSAVWLQTNFLELVRELGGRSAEGQLSAIIDVVEHLVDQIVADTASANFHGCIFINASMEFPLLHDPAHQAAILNHSALTRILHDIAERAHAESPQALAEELVLLIQGAYVTRQLTGDRSAFTTARKILRQTLAAHGVVAKRSSVGIKA